MENSAKGFIPVMLTPFLGDGRIDFKALGELTEMYIRAGASGLFANCLSSEMFELSSEERLKVIQYVIEVVDGAIPVVGTGTFGGSLLEQADFMKRVNDLGTEAVIIITSLLATKEEGEKVFNQRVFDLLDLTFEIPLGFYECPVPYKRTLTAEQLSGFVKTGRIIYHKDTCLDLELVKAKLNIASPGKFGLYDAYMAHAVESLRAGSAGLSCIQGNYFPELISWICTYYNEPAMAVQVEQVQCFLIEHMEVMHHVYPVVSKYFLQQRGFGISTFTRRNVGDFSLPVRRNIEQLFKAYVRMQNELDIRLTI